MSSHSFGGITRGKISVTQRFKYAIRMNVMSCRMTLISNIVPKARICCVDVQPALGSDYMHKLMFGN